MWASDIHVRLLDSHIVGITNDTPGKLREAYCRLRTRILRSHIVGMTNDTTGQLREAHLRLRARIFEVQCSKNKRFQLHPNTTRNSNALEVILGGGIYPGFLTFDDPVDHSRFFAIRDGMPASYGQVQFMPVAFSPIEAYGTRW